MASLDSMARVFRLSPRSVAGLASLLACGVPSSAAADTGGAPPAAPPAKVPLSPPAAELGASQAPSERALARLERDAAAAGLDPAVLGRPLREARRALARAASARASGDERHAAMLDRLATEWSDVGRTLCRAARAEASARAEAQRAADLRVRLERSRALLAEQQAHRWRLRADLERLTGAAPAAPPGGGGKP